MKELREAVRGLVDLYTGEWLLGKNGFLSPYQAMAQGLAQASLARAA